jgi:hypothetical protein
MWLALLISLVVVLSESAFTLQTSTAGQLIIAESTTQLRQNGQRRIVARSYSGNPWEVVPDGDFEPVKITCATSCVIDTVGDFAYVYACL